MTRYKPYVRGGGLLPVLHRASHEDLKLIAEALDRSWDVTIKHDERYEQASHNLTIIPEVFAEHLCRAGGNSFANMWRGGKGPSYEEVLHDVCGVMNVQVRREDGVLAMEEKMLHVVVERVWNEMSPKEREEVVRAAEDELKKAGNKFEEKSGSNLWALPFSLLAAQIGARLAGFITYQVAVQIANAAARQLLGHGLKLAANAAIARAVAVVTGPVGWIFSVLWAAVDIAGPSYKGLAPAVFHVAVLRQSMLLMDE